MFVSPPIAWRRLRDMQDVVTTQRDVAHAVRCLSLYDQLGVTLELLQQDYWPEFQEPDDLPENVIRFRPARSPLIAPITAPTYER